MKNHSILKNLRRTLQKQLLFPVLLFIFSLTVLQRTPKDNFFNPRPLNYKSNFENFYNRDLPYVTVSVPRLIYTGLDYTVDGHMRGHYYYVEKDGFCQFYILGSEAGSEPAKALESVNLRGRLIKMDAIEYDEVVENMAEDLDWNSDSLKSMTSDYAVSTVPYPVYFNFLFFAVLYGCLILSVFDILCFVFYLAAAFV